MDPDILVDSFSQNTLDVAAGFDTEFMRGNKAEEYV